MSGEDSAVVKGRREGVLEVVLGVTLAGRERVREATLVVGGVVTISGSCPSI